MERNRSLTGAGPALHDQYTTHIIANDFILFALDGCHNVAHDTGARGTYRGQQGAGSVFIIRGGKNVILKGLYGAPAQHNVTPPSNTLRVSCSGLIERCSFRCSPINE